MYIYNTALTVSSQCVNGATSLRYCVDLNCELCFVTTIQIIMNNMYSTISVFLVILATAFCENEITDDNCKAENNGTCIQVLNCPYVLKLIVNKDLEKINNLKCGFEGTHPKVCCPKGEVPILYDVHEETATNRPKPLTTLKPEVTSRFAPNKREETDKTFPDKSMCGIYTAVSDRIVGGTITEVDEHPWLARIRYKIDGEDIFGCSAVLITDRYLLTAAHCVQKNKQMSIRLGEWNTKTKTDCHNDICNERTIDVNVSSITIHPTYYAPSRSADGDIALIQLEEAVTFTEFIQPICLPVSKYIALQDYSSDSVYLTSGWGQTELELESVVKRQVHLNAAPIEVCRDLYNFKAESQSNIICVGGTKGKDTCRGDSGGPLIKLVSENYEVNWYLFGITSFGSSKCGAEGVPGMYTRVTAYMEWIREIVSK